MIIVLNTINLENLDAISNNLNTNFFDPSKLSNPTHVDTIFLPDTNIQDDIQKIGDNIKGYDVQKKILGKLHFLYEYVVNDKFFKELMNFINSELAFFDSQNISKDNNKYLRF